MRGGEKAGEKEEERSRKVVSKGGSEEG